LLGSRKRLGVFGGKEEILAFEGISA